MIGEVEKRKIRHAHWNHKRVEYPNSLTGYLILPECVCSACGYYVTRERPSCPGCRAIMDEPVKD